MSKLTSLWHSLFTAAPTAAAKPVVADKQALAQQQNVTKTKYSLRSLQDIMDVQNRLSYLGYLDPPGDGAWGNVSRWALYRFATDNSMEVPTTLDFNDDQIKALQRAKQLPLDLSGEKTLAVLIVKRMLALGMWVSRVSQTYTTAYVEGMDPDGALNTNYVNGFYDIRTLIEVQKGRPVLVKAYTATTEPGFYWGRDHLMNEEGAFHVALDTQQKCHIMGYYHTREALIQAGNIRGTRDPDKTMKRDLRHPVIGDFGVHQHDGYDLLRNDLKNSSAGCLVGEFIKEHAEFISYNKSDKRYIANPTYKFMFCVLDGTRVVGK